MVIVGVWEGVFPAMQNYPLNLYQLQVPYYSQDVEKWETIYDG